MAIPVEMLNLIVPIHLIEQHYPGGWEQCRRDHQDCPSAWHDEQLFRLGAMNGMDMMLMLEHWKELGFKAHFGCGKPSRWRELCIVDIRGPTLPCNWITVDLKARTASFKPDTAAGHSPNHRITTMNNPEAERISRLLFDADPMHTCCRQNDCIDEYDAIAADIIHGLAQGKPLKQAIKQALTHAFGKELATRSAVQRTLTRPAGIG
ncbi:hypothetical protein PU634_13490 [Oceanimonas pelagia]|uniref:Uncharacterized protein n=1 Tax=Oceanimonas pelagia TaxID=3028314 RepID=A0AA50KM53_9GAMM|nr:hypothetical protein [Oceanimonas pelagia]WMC10094.1 hypothetical protein PU634_13490 [Oceanimonas pelagia]